MFDFFTAALRCPGCDTVVPDPEIQTHIRGGGADGSALEVGFQFTPIKLDRAHLEGAGYMPIQSPSPGGPIRLLDVWSCPACDTEQWAMVEIVDRVIRRIEAVTLDRATFESAHYIEEDNAGLVAYRLLDGTPAGEASSVEVLRQRLA